ncbi:guanine deaminase [Chromobacterium sphagni]|uniref:Guanine deaminase n=1 Tax=Chromobacterium sphagni TaxID=1903179 RepID=A0A1S1WZG6_9NEIS|nr:guanine deaminase [Chromobacterium sphagni]OHX12458.1 guanine deaminase [Chromobacterium sphagni]OHX21458.1 guanine deaminase [Chromobacterium sphagni]
MKTAVRGDVLTFRGNPFREAEQDSLVFQRDALVVMENGRIAACGPAAQLLPTLGADAVLAHYPDHLILPGFIDCHVHYPQTEMMAAYGEQLLDWLQHYTFITEQGFADEAHAREVARVFLSEQLRNGVTTSCVFGTVHAGSVDVLFEEAARIDLRILAGKVCMDRHAPDALLDTPLTAYEESRALIRRWHGQGRAEYVITPRFAPTSSHGQLEMLGALAAEFPDVPIQSHIAENLDEIAWVKQLFPDCRDYAGVYQRYGLLRPRAIYGHGIHLSDTELEMFHASGAVLAHCPTSNFFLGSGSLDLRRCVLGDRPVKVGLGSDLGAGTSFSMLQTMNGAYMAAQSHGKPLSAAQAFYLATRGGAEALGIADRVGSVEAGMEADLAVLDLRSTPLLDFRMRYARDLGEAMFVQMMLGDDRAVAATYVAGKRVYQRQPN